MIVAFGELLLTVLAMEADPEVVVVAAAVGAVSPPMEKVTRAVKQEVVVKAAVVEVGAVNLLVAAGDEAAKVAHLANAGQDLDHLAQFLMLLPPVVPE